MKRLRIAIHVVVLILGAVIVLPVTAVLHSALHRLLFPNAAASGLMEFLIGIASLLIACFACAIGTIIVFLCVVLLYYLVRMVFRVVARRFLVPRYLPSPTDIGELLALSTAWLPYCQLLCRNAAAMQLIDSDTYSKELARAKASVESERLI